MRSFALLLAVLGAVACGGRTAPVRVAEAARDESDLKGEHLYRARCAACHRLRDPLESTPKGWADAVHDYGEEAHLTEAEAKLILGYLQGHARREP